MLPLGKVGPIETRQLAHGHIDERPPIMVCHRYRRVIKGYGGIFVVVGLALFFLLLLPLRHLYDSSSSPSSELLDMLDDALVAFSSSSFFPASLLFLLASPLSLLSSFLCFFSSNHCSSFFFSLASLFSFLASFLLLLSLSLRALLALVASSYGSVVLLAVNALSSLLSVSTSTCFTPLVPPPDFIPHVVKRI